MAIREYAFVEVFANKEEFDEWWAGEKEKWRVLERHETKSVETDYYRCQYGRRTNYHCQKVLRVDYCGLDQSVIVFESVGEHSDEPNEKLDSTCKLNWYGFPVQVAGFSDSNRRFHPTLLAVSHSEDTWSYSEILRMLYSKGYVPQVVLADGAKEITAAGRVVFPAARRAMCWAHVVRQFRAFSSRVGLKKPTISWTTCARCGSSPTNASGSREPMTSFPQTTGWSATTGFRSKLIRCAGSCRSPTSSRLLPISSIRGPLTP
ncbi:hypothetical protein AAVH_13031, partial [Aphelenchoides avenae]